MNTSGINNNDIVILGAGLAGLSAAYHLKYDYTLFEKEMEPGGMARSIYKDGYIFDYDGHLLHFKNDYGFKLVSGLMGKNMASHIRDSWVYSKGSFTRYPFQANFYGLPKSIVKDCLVGLIRAKMSPSNSRDLNGNFENWIVKTFGQGIAEHFMLPYNRKFWTIESAELTCEWLDGFIPVPDIEDSVQGAISDNMNLYGYNSRFWYPIKGGMSELVKCFSSHLKNINLNKKAVTIDQFRHEIIFEDATIKKYKRLISTIPLPELFKLMVNLPRDVKDAFLKLRHTSIFILNIGIKNHIMQGKHWVYYPEEDIIFYRVGFPTNFSSHVAPENRTSMYVEIAYSDAKKIDKEKIIPSVIEQLLKLGLISQKEDIETCVPMDIKYGYIIYDSYRKPGLTLIKDYLKRFHIHSIGRYGSWRYMSMEDVIMEGKELAECQFIS